MGNIVLKFAEEMARTILRQLKGELSKNVLASFGALVMKPVFKKYKKTVDASEYGGLPLLGLNGVCVICHGASNSRALMNAIRVAAESVSHSLNERISEKVEAKTGQTANL